MKIAAIQMMAEFASVEANLKIAEKLANQAFSEGAHNNIWTNNGAEIKVMINEIPRRINAITNRRIINLF